jgi:hypothetical protein
MCSLAIWSTAILVAFQQGGEKFLDVFFGHMEYSNLRVATTTRVSKSMAPPHGRVYNIHLEYAVINYGIGFPPFPKKPIYPVAVYILARNTMYNH